MCAFDVIVVGGGSSVWRRRGRSRSTVDCAAWCSRPRTASLFTRPATTAASCTPASTTSRARSRRSSVPLDGRRFSASRRRRGSRTSAAARWSSPSRENELPRLDELERRGRENGLAGIERLDAAGSGSTSRTPRGIAGLFVPETGIVDYVAVPRPFADEIRAAGGAGAHGRASCRAIRRAGGRRGRARGERFAAAFLVGCAGLASDRLARLPASIRGAHHPLPGRLLRAPPEARQLVRHLIYPVPDPDCPSSASTSPAASTARSRPAPTLCSPGSVTATRGPSFSLRDAASMLAFPGFWRMAPHYAGIGLAEYRRAWSRGSSCARCSAWCPRSASACAPGRLRRARAGYGPLGQLLDDFVFAEGERQLHVLNAPSPAATASLAIGEFIAGTVLAQSLRRAERCPAALHRRRLHRRAVRRQSRPRSACSTASATPPGCRRWRAR